MSGSLSTGCRRTIVHRSLLTGLFPFDDHSSELQFHLFIAEITNRPADSEAFFWRIVQFDGELCITVRKDGRIKIIVGKKKAHDGRRLAVDSSQLDGTKGVDGMLSYVPQFESDWEGLQALR